MKSLDPREKDQSALEFSRSDQSFRAKSHFSISWNLINVVFEEVGWRQLRRDPRRIEMSPQFRHLLFNVLSLASDNRERLENGSQEETLSLNLSPYRSRLWPQWVIAHQEVPHL